MSHALRLLQLASRVRTCDDCCVSCRALAADLIENDPAAIEDCGRCGFPKFSGEACQCERFIGEPANPASERWKTASSLTAPRWFCSGCSKEMPPVPAHSPVPRCSCGALAWTTHPSKQFSGVITFSSGVNGTAA
jgi:hypothetical protein